MSIDALDHDPDIPQQEQQQETNPFREQVFLTALEEAKKNPVNGHRVEAYQKILDSWTAAPMLGKTFDEFVLEATEATSHKEYRETIESRELTGHALRLLMQTRRHFRESLSKAIH